MEKKMDKNLVMIEAIQVITITDINLKDFRDQSCLALSPRTLFHKPL